MAKIIFYQFLRKIYDKYIYMRNQILFYTTPLGLRGKDCQIAQPSLITMPKCVYLHDYARLNRNNIILNHRGKFVMGKYSVAAPGLKVVTDMHTSTVGIPQCCLGASHVNDKVYDVIIDEDVWIGINVLLLGGCHIQRGCVIGANTIVNKKTITPPLCSYCGESCTYNCCKIQYRWNPAA